MAGAQQQGQNKQPLSRQCALARFTVARPVILLAAFANMAVCDATTAPGECSDGGAFCAKQAEVANVMLARQLTISKASTEENITGGAVVAGDMENVLQGLATRSADGTEVVPDSTLLILASVDAELDKIIANAANVTNIQQGAVNRAASDITECNANAGDISALAGTVSSKRSAHTTCRTKEKVDNATKTSKCTELESYRSDLQAPSCLTCGEAGVTGFEGENMACMQEFGDWYATTNRTWTSKKGLCDASTSNHTDRRSQCIAAQLAFESVFCIYEEALSLICNSQTTCRNNKTAERNTTHADARVVEESNKAEMVSATKAKCFLNALRADQSQQSAMVANCTSLRPSTSHLDITYPAIPNATECDLSVVATKPCDSAWLAAEYEDAEWYTDALPQECTSCVSTTTTTTTPTPLAKPT